MTLSYNTSLLLRQAPVKELVVRIVNPPGEDGSPAAPDRECTLVGRIAFGLRKLILAGERGLTAIERPAYRWSDYVFKLRGVGIVVETIREPHDGPYAGDHARYVLRSPVQDVEVTLAGEGRNAA